MISLRLSSEEYQALQRLYPSYGARNLSDFARFAIQRVIGHQDHELSRSKISEMELRLRVLEEKVILLQQQGGMAASAAHD
jgi:hypothetical protein